MTEELDADPDAQRILGDANHAMALYLRQHAEADPKFIASLSTETLGLAAADSIGRAHLYVTAGRLAGWHAVADEYHGIGNALHTECERL